MNTKSDNIEIIMGRETDETIKELFNLFYEDIKKDQKNQCKEESLFLIILIYCIIDFISLNRDGSYIDSLKRLKNKTAAINP